LVSSHQLHDVDLWAAHFDGHIQAILFVDARGNGLVKTNVFCLRIPVGHVGKFFVGVGALKACQTHESKAQASANCSSCCGFEAELFQGELLNVEKMNVEWTSLKFAFKL
jgi:hypothetical protein